VVIARRPGYDARPLPRGTQALEFDSIDISSTEIRRLIARGQSSDAWLPPTVARLIREHRLYRNS
jgi:nicotinic acid mononucleotide adenylyltransferase